MHVMYGHQYVCYITQHALVPGQASLANGVDNKSPINLLYN